jgi:hypothetical protein
MPRPGNGFGLRADASAAPGANDRVVRKDDALVFVDPTASAALETRCSTRGSRRGEVRFAFHDRN